MCEEYASFDLAPYDLASGIEAVNLILEEEAKKFQHIVNTDDNPESINSGLCINPSSVCMNYCKCLHLSLDYW